MGPPTSAYAGWLELGLDAWRKARLEAHWAAQVPAAFGHTVVPPREDFAHLSLSWSNSQGAFVTLPSEAGLRAALALGSLELRVLRGEERLASRSLAGASLEESLAWLAAAVDAPSLTRPEHELPNHAVEGGGRFAAGPPPSLGFLEAWYAASAEALEKLRQGDPHATPLRVWPHHFDQATLLILDPELDSEEARSVGCGFSPGDGSYDEPYFYVNPWPYPFEKELPELPAGAWHREGWIGAVLTGTQLAQAGDPEATLAAYLASAVASSRRLLA